MNRSPARNYILTDEQVDVILDRLNRFADDPDVEIVGKALAVQQVQDPNHLA